MIVFLSYMGMIQEGEGTNKPRQEQPARPHYFGVSERLSGAFLARSLLLGEVVGTAEVWSGTFRDAYAETQATIKWTREDFEKQTPKEATHVLLTRHTPFLGVIRGIAFRYIDLHKTPEKP